MSFLTGTLFTFAIGVLIFLVGVVLLVFKFLKKVEQGHALIVNKMRDKLSVSFTGMVVIPLVHKAEVMDISLKTIEIDRRGHEGLICKDNIRADIKVTFFVRVNKTVEDVLKVAQAIGCERASDREILEELFNAKFSEALKTVGKQLEFEQLYQERDNFRDRIIQVIGQDLNGYVLEDAAIDYLEQTPMRSLDPDNILDSQGIRKITMLTAEQHVLTNNYDRDEEMRIKKKDVEAREAILELERQQSDAEAKQQREVENVRAREASETAKVAAEERQKAEAARLQMEEQVAVQEENKQREIEVAAKNRERAVAIETERVERARQLEAIEREREVELQRIAKEKALEVERKEIQEVIRQRVAVEKTVAEEEERIKELRVVSEADRNRQAKVIEAEGEAQQLLVQDIKSAEAQEIAAQHKAKEQITLAEAEREAAEKKAQALIRLAEAAQAEAAAEGLAAARVKEANAIAIEKEGLAEARVMLEKQQAEAKGLEEKGMADVRIKAGLAEVYEQQGHSEAEAIKERMLAEAAGLTEKYAAMQSMGEAGREFEELRLKLELFQAVEMARIGAGQAVAEAQTSVLGEAMRSADIDIVGGESSFFDKMINAVSLGKSIDKLAEGDTVRTLFGGYLDGEQDLMQDMKEVLSGVSSDDLSNLSLSAFLAKVMREKGQGDNPKMQKLMDAAKSLENKGG